VKALACELPATYRLPPSRFSRTELHRLVLERGVSDASASTIWRWLHDDALKPWQRSWIFVRDPAFAAEAGRVLDLYLRGFEGRFDRVEDRTGIEPFDRLEALAERLLRFAVHYRQIAQPFERTFTRTDLDRLLARIEAHEPGLTLAA
jgi:hypothetical protein